MNTFFNFSEIKGTNCELMKIAKDVPNKDMDVKNLDKSIAKAVADIKGCPIDGNGGKWEGERGNSVWKPDRNETPKNPLTNPNDLTWGEILDKYNIDGIPFKDGEPDFSDISKGTVKIDDFTDDRSSNFDQADEKLAKQKGCTPEEVAKWREEHKYTWHECRDCETMQKVPTEVHGNISHSGGVSEYKSQMAA